MREGANPEDGEERVGTGGNLWYVRVADGSRCVSSASVSSGRRVQDVLIDGLAPSRPPGSCQILLAACPSTKRPPSLPLRKRFPGADIPGRIL